MKERHIRINRQISSVIFLTKDFFFKCEGRLDVVASTKLILIPQTKYLIILQIEAIITDHVYFFFR